MTISFLQTARYNAQPRLARLDDGRAKAAPQFDTLDDLIAAMQKDAKAISKRQNSERPKTSQTKHGPLAETKVLDFVRANPGASVNDIADHFGREPRSIATLLGRICERGLLRAYMQTNPDTKRPMRCFTIDQECGEKVGIKKVSVLDDVVDFILSNPGCTSADLADHMDCSKKSAAEKISRARKLANIVSKRMGGNNSPMSHWVQE